MSQKALECSWVVGRTSGSQKSRSLVSVIFHLTPAEYLLPSLAGSFWLKTLLSRSLLLTSSSGRVLPGQALPELKWKERAPATPWVSMKCFCKYMCVIQRSEHFTTCFENTRHFPWEVQFTKISNGRWAWCYLFYNYPVSWGERDDGCVATQRCVAPSCLRG